jgi:aspartyl-tRNA(Asn)/glutamyl-tRNA(Gln) amidotransferase subunit A
MPLSTEAFLAASARDLAAGVRARQFSAEDVARAALARLHQVEPSLHAYLDVFDQQALDYARAVDRKIAAGEDPGPLAGVPIALKDNLCLEGSKTTCASRMLSNYVPPYTATAVSRLLAAGAVPLGKTNLDEFAMGSSTENSALGVTRNPWDRKRVPGGSSGGSAVAVASGTAPLALGSDTGGSIRQPAAFTGVVGLKPTYGRVSRYGLVAFASSLDQIGPFAKDALDAALLLAVISGHDPLDSTSAERPVAAEWANLKAPATLKGLKVGVPQEYFVAGLDTVVERPCGKRWSNCAR